MKQIIRFFLVLPTLLLGDVASEASPPTDPTQEEVVNPLTPQEQIVYDQLGPIYKKVYLTFTEEERKRVVSSTRRGVDSYEAINAVLRVEQRQHDKKRAKKLTPREKAEQPRAPKVTILQNDSSNVPESTLGN